MATELRKTLIEDAERMEDAAIKLAEIRGTTICNAPVISILYWLCVAVLHLIEWTVNHNDMP